MSKLLHKSVVAAAAALSFAVAACSGAPTAHDVQEAGYQPTDSAAKVMTCYDFSGNEILKQNVKDFPNVSNTGVISDYNNTYTVANAAGCKIEATYAKGDFTKARHGVTAIASAGPAIVLNEQFTKMSSSDNDGVTYTLESMNGTKLRQVQIIGLTTFGTKSSQGISPELKQTLGL